MKTNSLIFMLSFVLVFSCTNKKYSIVCDFDGIKNDTVLVWYFPESRPDTEICDTSFIVDHTLKLNFQPDEIYEIVIVPYFFLKSKTSLFGRRISFSMNPDEKIYVKVHLIDSLIFDYDVKGNLLSEQGVPLRKKYLELIKKRARLDDDFYSKQNHLSKEYTDEYWKKRQVLFDTFQNIQAEYASQHPDEIISAAILQGLKDKNKIIEIYNQLTPKVKNSYYGKIVGKRINAWKITTPGMEFPNIVDKTVFNKDFSLYQHRNKYVLIDFWGSWCAPCLSEINNLMAMQEKYKDQLLIVGIACKDSKSNLINTLKKYKITYPQILEKPIEGKDYSTKFGIVSFPTKILLDKDGKVIKSYVGTNEKLYNDIETLLGKK